MKVYISGKISGLGLEANALFLKAEEFLIEQGHEVINPIKLPHEIDSTWAQFMKEDIKALCGCQAIYMLSNWRESKGAAIEHMVAIDLDMEIMYEYTPRISVFRQL